MKVVIAREGLDVNWSVLIMNIVCYVSDPTEQTMPPPKSRNKNLMNNLLSKKTDSKGVQTATMLDSKCVQTEKLDDRVTKENIIEFINSASLSEKCDKARSWIDAENLFM